MLIRAANCWVQLWVQLARSLEVNFSEVQAPVMDGEDESI